MKTLYVLLEPQGETATRDGFSLGPADFSDVPKHSPAVNPAEGMGEVEKCVTFYPTLGGLRVKSCGCSSSIFLNGNLITDRIVAWGALLSARITFGSSFRIGFVPVLEYTITRAQVKSGPFPLSNLLPEVHIFLTVLGNANLEDARSVIEFEFNK